jgi:hypothetical protein
MSHQIGIVAVPLTHDTLDLPLVLELKASRLSGVHEDLEIEEGVGTGGRGGAEHVVSVVAFKVL